MRVVFRFRSLLLSTVILTAASLGACASVREGGARLAADAVIPPDDEIAIGKKMRVELEKELTLHPSAEVQNYIKALGKKLATHAKSPVPLRFHVVKDDKQINAFAIPGGDIYVYTGLMKAAHDEAELACVLGHEISHVTRRHVAQQPTSQLGLQAVQGLVLGDKPGVISGLASQLAQTGVLLKFSRDHERDADEHGLPLCNGRGFDPNGLVRMFQTFKKEGEAPAMLAFLQSHPLPSERITAARALIKTLKPLGTETNVDSYRTLQAKL